jgi:hypothetical protein
MPLFNAETAKLDHFGKCPKCNADWSAGDIFTILRAQEWCQDTSDEALRKSIEECYSPPYKFSRLVGVELPHTHPEHYDGVSLWQCPDCKQEWPRFN